MARWAAELPFEVDYLAGLWEGWDGGPATAGDAETYARLTGLPTPVLADPSGGLTRAVPWNAVRPTRCALSPRMEILHCYAGEPSDPDQDPAILAIQAHYEQFGP